MKVSRTWNKKKILTKLSVKFENKDECAAFKELVGLYIQAYGNGDNTDSDEIVLILEELLKD